MSIADVKAAIERYSAASENADETNKNENLRLLREEEFIKGLRKLWEQLPNDTKNKISKAQAVRRRAPRRKPKIINSPEQNMNISRWTKNHQSFFDEIFDEDSLVNTTGCPISYAYNAILQSKSRHSRDTSRIRFNQVLFYHLKVRLDVKNFRDDTIGIVAEIIRKSSGVDFQVSTIINNIMDWAKSGKKYDGLCWDLAAEEPASEEEYRYLGAIFYLPSDVTERSLKDIPDTGDSRYEKVESFKDRGILQVENKRDIDTLAHCLFSDIWKRVEAVISELGQNSSLLSFQEWRRRSHAAFWVRITRERGPVNEVPSPEEDTSSQTNSSFLSSEQDSISATDVDSRATSQHETERLADRMASPESQILLNQSRHEQLWRAPGIMKHVYNPLQFCQPMAPPVPEHASNADANSEAQVYQQAGLTPHPIRHVYNPIRFCQPMVPQIPDISAATNSTVDEQPSFTEGGGQVNDSLQFAKPLIASNIGTAPAFSETRYNNDAHIQFDQPTTPTLGDATAADISADTIHHVYNPLRFSQPMAATAEQEHRQSHFPEITSHRVYDPLQFSQPMVPPTDQNVPNNQVYYNGYTESTSHSLDDPLQHGRPVVTTQGTYFYRHSQPVI